MASAIFHIEGGIGKNVAATAVVSAYKKANPKRKIIVVSAWPEVWIKNPDIARFYAIGNTPYFYQDVIRGKDVEVFPQDPYKTTDHITKKGHLIKNWCKMVGVKHNGEKPILNFNFREVEEGRAYVSQFADGRPTLLFQPFGGPGPDHQQHPYSWTRDMHPNQAQELINKLASQYNIIHVCYEFHPRLENCHRFDKIIGKKALFSMLAHSDRRLLIDSSLQHAAAALKLKSTVLWVATEPAVFGYKIHNNITTKAEYKNGHIDSYLFDYDFTGVIHQCPFNSQDELHDVDAIIKSIG
jgi:hypothetical protein|tara:strand:- start:1891 stop:2781 length:891 start_codon:yes stop_codon:yes gene_type:complete